MTAIRSEPAYNPGNVEYDNTPAYNGNVEYDSNT